jgi:Caudovirus prohead serine protease
MIGPPGWSRLSEAKRYASTASAPRTFNADQRTVEAVLSRGSPVVRSYGTEKLRISKSAVDLSRLQSGGVPLLDSHNQYGIDNVLGRVQTAWFEGGALVGRVKFNETEQGQRAMGMIERDELSSFSVGYTVNSWAVYDNAGNLLDPERDRIRLGDDLTFEATKWSLLELSLVAVPADQAAVVRSFGGNKSLRQLKEQAFVRMQTRQRWLSGCAMMAEPWLLPGWTDVREMRTCWHESSHAVVSRHLFQKRLLHATVIPGRRADGTTYRGRVRSRKSQIRNIAKSFIVDNDAMEAASPRLVQNVQGFAFHRIVVAVAGSAGKRLFCDLDGRPAGVDKRNAEQYAALICRTSTGIRRLLQAADAEAEEILNEHDYAVRALAIALRDNRTLTGRQIDMTIAKAITDHDALLRSPAGAARARMLARQRAVEGRRL